MLKNLIIKDNLTIKEALKKVEESGHKCVYVEKKNLQKFVLQNKFVNNLINVNSVKKLLLKKHKDNQECHLIFGILNIILLLKKYSGYKNVFSFY